MLVEPIQADVNVAPVDPCTPTNIGCIINHVLDSHFEPLTTGITYSTGALYDGHNIIAGTQYQQVPNVPNTTEVPQVPTALALVTLAYKTHDDKETVQLVVDVEREFKAALSQLATVQVVPAKQHIEHVAEHHGGHFDWGTIGTAAIGLAILGWHIGAFKAVAITLINILLVYMVSFRIVGWYTDHEPVLTFGPELMLAIIVAFCIDYSLFIVKPYCIEARKGRVYSSAAAMKVFWENYVVVLFSCIVLCLCFLTLLWVRDIKALTSLAWACIITVICTTLANLTVTPALMAMRGVRWALLPSPQMYSGAHSRSTDARRTVVAKSTYLTRKLMPVEAERAESENGKIQQMGTMFTLKGPWDPAPLDPRASGRQCQ